MNDPSSIIGTWFHSYEEDTDTARVYRPRGFPFPRSRGRPGFEFRQDGTYVEYDGGPDDRGRARVGQWQDLGHGRVRTVLPETDPNPHVHTVLSVDDEILTFESGQP
ncbi:hypothetical protein [Rhodococcus sp. 5G237]